MTVSQVLQQLQANTFLQAAEMTGIKQQFDLPGFAATVLAPSDTAFAALLNGMYFFLVSGWAAQLECEMQRVLFGLTAHQSLSQDQR